MAERKAENDFIQEIEQLPQEDTGYGADLAGSGRDTSEMKFWESDFIGQLTALPTEQLPTDPDAFWEEDLDPADLTPIFVTSLIEEVKSHNIAPPSYSILPGQIIPNYSRQINPTLLEEIIHGADSVNRQTMEAISDIFQTELDENIPTVVKRLSLEVGIPVESLVPGQVNVMMDIFHKYNSTQFSTYNDAADIGVQYEAIRQYNKEQGINLPEEPSAEMAAALGRDFSIEEYASAMEPMTRMYNEDFATVVDRMMEFYSIENRQQFRQALLQTFKKIKK